MQRSNAYRNYGSYNSGSVAYDYETQYQFEDNQIFQHKALQRELKKQSRHLIIQRVKLFFAVAMIFGGCIATMTMHANIEEQKIINIKMQDQISQLNNQNNMISAEITEQLSLDYIAKEATLRLGMKEPQAYQISYIDVAKESYTVQYETTPKENKFSFDFSTILNIFEKS